MLGPGHRDRGGQEVGGWAIAATYMGTVVGAGFASGQEILRFFAHFGGRGAAGLALATLLLAAGGVGVMRWGQETCARSYRDGFLRLLGPWLGSILDAVVSVVLFGGLSVMAAGSGALFHEQLGWGTRWGAVVLLAAAVATVWFGLRGVVRANQVVVPLLVLSVVAVGVLSVSARPLAPGWAWMRPEAAAHPRWVAAAMLYGSYNLFLSLGVLLPLGAGAASPQAILRGGAAGGVGLGVAASAVYVAILGWLPEAAAADIPMLVAAAALPPWGRMAYAVVLFGEVYTTAVANLFSLERRVAGGHPGRRWPLLLLAVFAFLLSGVGFARLVVTLYPLIGYVGLGLLLVLLGKWAFGRGGSP